MAAKIGPSLGLRAVFFNKLWYAKIRAILGISWVRMRDQHITNERCAEMLGVPDWRVIVGRRSTRWLGHVARMAPTRLARQTLFGFVENRAQKRRVDTEISLHMHMYIIVHWSAEARHEDLGAYRSRQGEVERFMFILE